MCSIIVAVMKIDHVAVVAGLRKTIVLWSLRVGTGTVLHCRQTVKDNFKNSGTKISYIFYVSKLGIFKLGIFAIATWYFVRAQNFLLADQNTKF